MKYLTQIIHTVIRLFMTVVGKNGKKSQTKSGPPKDSDTPELIPDGSPETMSPESDIKVSADPTSVYHYLIDNGHGGWLVDDDHPDGYYPTAGKRSPKDPETGETLIYEGVNNRINSMMIVDELRRMRISSQLLVPEEEDISLSQRVKRANDLHREKKCILISVHSNASGNGKEWGKAKGISLHISENRSKTTDTLVEIMGEQFEEDFKNVTRWRGIKFNNFFITKRSNSPAILLEIGFHDNLEEARKMLTDEWRILLVKSVTHAIITFEDSHLK